MSQSYVKMRPTAAAHCRTKFQQMCTTLINQILIQIPRGIRNWLAILARVIIEFQSEFQTSFLNFFNISKHLLYTFFLFSLDICCSVICKKNFNLSFSISVLLSFFFFLADVLILHNPKPVNNSRRTRVTVCNCSSRHFRNPVIVHYSRRKKNHSIPIARSGIAFCILTFFSQYLIRRQKNVNYDFATELKVTR